MNALLKSFYALREKVRAGGHVWITSPYGGWVTEKPAITLKRLNETIKGYESNLEVDDDAQ